jgi:hypothetical protein
VNDVDEECVSPPIVRPTATLTRMKLVMLLKNLGPPLMVFGDFNAHSQSWGCNTDDTRARIVQTMLDDLAPGIG